MTFSWDFQMTSFNCMTIIRVFNNIDQLLHSLSNSMNQEQQNQASYVNEAKDRTPNQLQSQNNQLQDEVLEEESSSDEQSSQDSRQSQKASEDELLQKPAFFINEEQLLKIKLKSYPNQQQNTNQKQKVTEEQQQSQICDDLEEDEVDAFLYLLQVRKEKKSLLKEKKKSKKEAISIQKPETINNQKTTVQEKDKISHQNYVSCSNAVLSNFNILIANLKYLIKTSQSYRQNSKPKNMQLFSSINLDNSDPKVYELMYLTVGQIEELMKKLSHQIIPKSKCVKDRNQNIEKFCLWIHTLLSLHQAWSSYKHFSELAEVNFALQRLIALVTKKTLIINPAPQLEKKQEQNNHKLDETNSGQSKTANNLPQQRVPNSLLTLLILLIQVFEQKHLTKHVSSLLGL